MSPAIASSRRAFTLLEVMVAVAFIGIALTALLSLQHTDLQSVTRGQDLTAASSLAQALMTQAEIERFPAVGSLQGDFSRAYQGQYPNFRWQRIVDASSLFPDVHRVRIRVIYGPAFSRSFELTEFMRNPFPPPEAAVEGDDSQNQPPAQQDDGDNPAQ